MRPGTVAIGIVILAISALFYYIETPTATPAAMTVGGASEVSRATPDMAKYWGIAGMIIGAVISAVGLLIPRHELHPEISPMPAYARTHTIGRRRI